MRLYRTSVWHELLILGIYLFICWPVFAFFYPREISGDGGMVFVIPTIVTVLSTIIMLPVIIATKKEVKGNAMELWYGIILLIVSTGISFFFINAGDAYPALVESNTAEIVFLYAFSLYYKWEKRWLQNS